MMRFLNLMVFLSVAARLGESNVCPNQQTSVLVEGEYKCVDIKTKKCVRYEDRPSETIYQRNISTYLIAHYAFESNVNDTSGNSRHGVIEGNNYDYTPTGIIGAALNLSGTTRVLVTSFENFDYGSELSASLWFMTYNQTLSPMGLLNNGFKTSGTWEIRTRAGYHQLTASVSYPPAAYAELPFNYDEWQHVAMTYNGTELLFYLNGVMQPAVAGTSCCSGPIVTSPNRVTIGQMGVGRNDRYFLGLMDEVKLFNISLTPEEVLSLFNV
ncbi:uncharacterized protein [Antedon mediterranea]|uniref:uncharacterized protein n=1 Tax=Antedon mediterranea TaxID=105859 RepID=UPI003AF9009A